jgi:hypothetical protein
MICRWTNLCALLGLALGLSTPNGAAAQQAAKPDAQAVGGSGVAQLEVHPDKLALLVGEIADLSIVSPSATPIRISSSKPGIVEVTSHNRLIGRSEGIAEVEVAQGSRSRTVDVGVARAEFQSIAIDPSSVAVAVDETVYPRVVARIKGDPTGREVELAPDLLACDKTPSPRYADFNAERRELRGIMPTERSCPQTLAMRFGALAAKAPVEVVVAPLRLELTPAGPLDLPLGQMVRLQGWAHYSGRRVVAVPAQRLTWQIDQSLKPAPGIELRGDKVAALKAGGGPLSVSATYFGKQSNAVVLKSVAADPNLTLRVDVDRTIRLAGEPGQLVLAANCPRGDVELVPEMADYKSSTPAIVDVNAKLGDFRAAAPGESTVTLRHPAAKQPATVKLRVFDPARARLVFDPDTACLAVHEQAALPLFLEVQDGAKTQRAAMEGPGIAYCVARPDAVRWSPPTLLRLLATQPFALTAGYAPYLKSTATARVEVLAAAAPAALRVVPSTASLAPGQTVSLAVQQQLPGSEQWKEVRPDAVSWTVPAEAVWEPASASLRPALTVPPDAKGEIQLRAELAGKEARATVSVKDHGPETADPAVRLVAVREPGGQYLPVGAQQRYTIMVEDKDGRQEPATGVRWSRDFENKYVKWQAPVLTAKEAGAVPCLRADVGGRTVLLHTTTYVPGKLAPGDNPDAPAEVVILSDQGPAVQFPVGAEFDDFRVEARYRDGTTRLVTKKAMLITPGPPPSAPLTPSNGRLIGVHPGQTSVAAEFAGVHTKKFLDVTVAEEIDADEICVVPAAIALLRGETIRLGVVGKKAGKSIGDITGAGDVTWQSDNRQIARVEGRCLTGVKPGQVNVTASLGAMASRPARVSVVDSIADPLRADPGSIRLVVGQGVRVGSEVTVSRGDMDVSNMCAVTPLQPECVRYIPETRTLVGVAPGPAQVALALGDKCANVAVEVLPAAVGGAGGDVVEGDVRIEPANTTLAPGQGDVVRVYAGPADRTVAATLASSDPKVVMIRGNMLCALAPGNAEIFAKFPGSSATGRAYVTVNNEQITELIADPLRLEVGDTSRLPILGKTAGGIHELFPQADLKLSAGGQNPAAIALPGGIWIKGVASGEATVEMTWRNNLKEQVAATVVNNPWGNLRINPGQATINKGQALKYEVTASKGGLVRVLGPEQGLQLAVGDANVAQVLDDLSVGAKQEGRTTVVAKYGALTAEAALDVAAGNAVATGVVGAGGVIVQPPGVTTTDCGERVFPGGATDTQSTGDLTNVDVKAARLVATPDPLALWVGESGSLGSVRLDPGGGQPSFPVDFQAAAPDGQNVVRVDYDNKISGLAKGGVQLTVTPTDPKLQGLATNVAVQVDNPDPLRIDPADMTLQVGQSTPPLTLSGKGPDGTPYQVSATLENQDEKVLGAAPDTPGRFVAKAMGRTQLKARYKGVDLFATVTVPGKRFVEVKTAPNPGDKKFDATIDVVASAAEGPLAYRAYVDGETPPDTWTPNEPRGDSRHVVLHSSKPAYGSPGTLYHLIIEARDAATKQVQQYSLTLHVRS